MEYLNDTEEEPLMDRLDGSNPFANIKCVTKSADSIHMAHCYVVSRQGNGIFVSIDKNSRHTYFIPFDELTDKEQLEEGGTVDCFVEQYEDGTFRVNRRAAARTSDFARMMDALESGEILIGHVTANVYSGLKVEVLGIKTFMPNTHIKCIAPMDRTPYVGRDMELRVINIDTNREPIVSHKACLEDIKKQKAKEFIKTLVVGQDVKGVVTTVMAYGAFVDIGDVIGLVHYTNLSWNTGKRPNQIVSIGDELVVRILRIDADRNRVELGLKQTIPDPWLSLNDKLHVGDRISGTVTAVADYGIFVSLECGVDGFVHQSEMSWYEKRPDPHKYNVGDDVKMQVETFDVDSKKVNLSIKKIDEDPWYETKEEYQIGSVHKFKISGIVKKGAFVRLENGMRGFVNAFHYSWNERRMYLRGLAVVGDEIEVIVQSYDEKKRIVILGRKQLIENSWENINDKLKEGDRLSATIKEITVDEINVIIDRLDLSAFILRNTIKGEVSLVQSMTIMCIVADINSEKKRIQLFLAEE